MKKKLFILINIIGFILMASPWWMTYALYGWSDQLPIPEHQEMMWLWLILVLTLMPIGIVLWSWSLTHILEDNIMT